MLVPSLHLSFPGSLASWVTLDPSLPLPASVSPSVPAWPWVQGFPGPVRVGEDGELQIDAQISQPEPESGLPPPEIPLRASGPFALSSLPCSVTLMEVAGPSRAW